MYTDPNYFSTRLHQSSVWPNDQSLNETIWTLKCDKLHAFDMMEEIKIKSLLIEYYLCTQQNFMK